MTLLRKSLLESELLHNQLQYEKTLRAYNLANEVEKKAMQCILDGLSFEIDDINKELDLVRANEKTR